MTASSGQPRRGLPPRRTVLLRSCRDGALIGAGAGVAYATVIGVCGGLGGGLVGGPAAALSGIATLAVVAGLVAVPAGVVLGTVFGTAFGLAAWTGLRRPVLLEVVVTAVFGVLVLALTTIGAHDVSSGALAWSSGPLVAGVPAAVLHGWRVQRRAG